MWYVTDKYYRRTGVFARLFAVVNLSHDTAQSALCQYDSIPQPNLKLRTHH